MGGREESFFFSACLSARVLSSWKAENVLLTVQDKEYMHKVHSILCGGSRKAMHETTIRIKRYVVYVIIASDVQVCHQGLSSAFDVLFFFLCPLIQSLTLTPPPKKCTVGKYGHVTIILDTLQMS